MTKTGLPQSSNVREDLPSTQWFVIGLRLKRACRWLDSAVKPYTNGHAMVLLSSSSAFVFFLFCPLIFMTAFCPLDLCRPLL